MARVLILVADGFPEGEVLPLAERLSEEGHGVDLTGPRQGAKVTGDKGATVTAARDPLHIDLNRAHAVIVPGGAAADLLAGTPSIVNVVYSVAHKGRLVATSGRGVQLLLRAGTQKSPNPVATGTKILERFLAERRVTGDAAFKDELERSGARFVADRAVVVDDPFITARSLSGADLERFLDELLPVLPRMELPVVARRI
jgi:putative intracellular protease/amidase